MARATTACNILDGGDGLDTAFYGYSSTGVRVSLLLQGEEQQDFDGTHGFTANNNEAAGRPLTDIEDIFSARLANDWLTGDGGNNYLFGDEGDDRLEGGYGNDLLSGGDGSDTLDGGALGLALRRVWRRHP